jgi:dTMP kinase
VKRGRLVAFEGGEGSGKSTQAARLARAIDAVLTREPGGTPLGERIRPLLLDPELSVDPRAEALLMAAARAQHVAEVVEPALAAGRDVVTDRFTPSSLAYQGHGRGLDVRELAAMSQWATGGLAADLVVLLAVPPEVGMARVGKPRDRLEAAGADFHLRVATAFREMAAADPERWVVIDGEGDPDDVARRVLDAWQAWSEDRAS